MTPDFSMETVKARRARTYGLQILTDHRDQPRLLNPAKLSIMIENIL